jgi:putative transport protein
MGGGSGLSKTPELFSWSRQIRLRAHQMTNPRISGKKAVEIEKLFPARVTIDKIKRGDKLFDVSTNTVVEMGDILVMAGGSKGMVPAADIIGHEVDLAEVTEMIGEQIDAYVLNPAIVGKTFGELGKWPEARGVFVRGITRQGREVPITPATIVNKCDKFRLVGPKDQVERAVKTVGYAERPTSATDFVMVGLGCVLGTLLGMIVIPIAGIPVSLSEAGGVLVAGLFAGWLRSMHPTFGQIPEGGQWILTDMGLNLFIACVGLSAGSQALHALQSNGISIFLAGIVVAIIPVMAGLIFGKYLLRMNPILLLGALTGARVIPPALNALEEDADSSVIVLGFAAPFAFANVFLTIMGGIIINLM